MLNSGEGREAGRELIGQWLRRKTLAEVTVIENEGSDYGGVLVVRLRACYCVVNLKAVVEHAVAMV